MRAIERYFIGCGIVFGLIGMLLGIHMGMGEDFSMSPLHAHINLFGWVTLVLFGLAYRAGIAKADGWATVHFWLALAAAVVFPAGIYFVIARNQQGLVILGSLLVVASMLLFLINFIRARNA